MDVATTISAGALRGAVVCMPALGLGSIAESAVDCLVSSLVDAGRVERTGSLTCPRGVPSVIGRSPFDGTKLQEKAEPALSLELYHVVGSGGDAARTFILQQRAAPLESSSELWAQALMRWLIADGVAQIVVIGAADVAGRQDDLIAAGTQSFGPWHIGDADRLAPGLSAAGSRPFPVQPELGQGADAPNPGNADAWSSWQPVTAEAHRATLSAFLPLSGLGLAPIYYRRALSGVRSAGASSPTTVPVTVLFIFAAEGDNRPEAVKLAQAAATVLGLGLPCSSIAAPSWWGKALEGPAFDQALYG